MKYSHLILILIFLLSACGSDNNKNKVVSDPQFSSTKMIKVLTDIQLLESLISTHRGFRDQEEQSLLFQKILNTHNLSMQEFDSTMNYLESNIELYQQILDSVKINLENMEKVSLPFLLEKDTLSVVKKKPSIKKNSPIKQD